MDNKLEFTTIDEYITQAPPETKEVLQKIRETIKAAAPEATEKISYQMPTFYLEGNLVHFAVAKNHYGFYPASSGIAAFESKLGNYKHSKGAVQFPIKEEVPYELIKEMTLFRLAENKQKATEKLAKKKKK
ncbi:iron chaperone [Listeria monocytogenes]|uniref:iron chaperone n=1 Tax=Listeria monocytogenes TaxID=1639 RepID=UPI00085C1A03|nr:iron chaperone [Listeria monocytogenes]EAA0192976.1 iron chaperone [Listeria monocytogenes]EAC2342305.1 iron chaperone [Listeria monocytogenes]EAC3619235.1 iron chaperone [Listeria monocytogenes]EAC4436694.1 iron chaperone [Listeria monocytogenes]EAC4735050.1 iron chaperone [Listeria monocytogenes]